MPDMFPHQTTGSRRLADGTPTYLGLDMGIGKTRTFIEAVKLRAARRVLVVCPASAVLVWKREIALWHPGSDTVVVRTPKDLSRPARYYVVSHGLMSQTGGPVATALGTAKFDMTALDEAHAFNAADTNRVKALRKAAPGLGLIVPLSGTPMKNHAGELYTLLSICWPQGLRLPSGTMTRFDFEERFCRVTHKFFGGSRPIRVVEGSKNLPALRVILEPFMMRVRKADVFKDLPAIIWDTVPVPLDPAHLPPQDLAKLDEAVNRIMQNEGPMASLDVLTDALRVMGNGVSIMTLRRMLGLAKLRGATEYIVDMLDNLPEDRKLLVFAHHAHVIGALTRHLGEYLPAVLVGTSTPKDREAAVDRFLTDPRCRVFIGNIQAAGTAITLVGPKCKCSDVVFVESSWTPMDNAQAACRVHRIGQKDGVVVRMLSAAGTVDDLISGLLVRKAREFTQLFDTQGTET
jgi:SWI/SNF-related matrix-associated actin-dependent regulator of chromatin subfamily A-like protein 1